MSGASKELKLRAEAYSREIAHKQHTELRNATTNELVVDAFRAGAISERAKLRRQGQLLVSNTDAWPASKVRIVLPEKD